MKFPIFGKRNMIDLLYSCVFACEKTQAYSLWLGIVMVLLYYLTLSGLAYFCFATGVWSTEPCASSLTELDIIFTSVTQCKLLLQCLTFWCGTNSRRPTASPSSPSPFRSIYLYLTLFLSQYLSPSSLPPLPPPPHLSLSLLWFGLCLPFIVFCGGNMNSS